MNDDLKMNPNEVKFLQDNKDINVSIYLVNGVRLECRIIGFDDFTLTTTQVRDGKVQKAPQLIYKSAIATIAPR